MRFDARDLKPFAEPVNSETLREGTVYFAVTFVDDDMLIPFMEPVVFAGRHLIGDRDELCFQDIDSYQQGVRYDTASPDAPATFHTGDAVKHMFEFERALDVLLRCSIRRREQNRA